MSSSVHLLTYFSLCFYSSCLGNNCLYLLLLLPYFYLPSAHFTQACIPRTAPKQLSTISSAMAPILPDHYSRFFDFIISASQLHLTQLVTPSCFSSCLSVISCVGFLGLSSKHWLRPQLSPGPCPLTILSFILRHRDSSLDVILGSVDSFISLDELIVSQAFIYHLYVFWLLIFYLQL